MNNWKATCIERCTCSLVGGQWKRAVYVPRQWPTQLLSGSAAARIESRLKRAGARLVVPPESFFMERDVPPQGEKRRHEMERLEPGEEERAAEWAAIILERMGAAREPGRSR